MKWLWKIRKMMGGANHKLYVILIIILCKFLSHLYKSYENTSEFTKMNIKSNA